MELARELPECPLDVGVSGATLDAEDLVVVALCCRHQTFEGTGTRIRSVLTDDRYSSSYTSSTSRESSNAAARTARIAFS